MMLESSEGVFAAAFRGVSDVGGVEGWRGASMSPAVTWG